MNSARPTPRYTGVIESTPHGPALPRGPLHTAAPQPFHQAGPQLVGGAARPSGRVRASSNGAGDGVLSLTGRQGGVEPSPLRVEPLSIESSRSAPPLERRPLSRVVPVERRPWRVMIVSAAPGAAPRSFEVSRWMARAALGAAMFGVLVVGALVAALVIAVRSPDPAAHNEVEALEAALAATRDSLALAREPHGVALAVPAAAAAIGGAPVAPVAPVASVAPAAPRSAPLAARREPRAVTIATVATAHPAKKVPAPEPDLDLPSDGVLNMVPRTVADLPVIGALVSGFSRARRHPLLHRVRPHLGVDLAAPRGTRVSAPAAGVVKFVGHRLGFGLVVELDHGTGVVTRYAHLRSAAVHAGETVRRGEAIAAVGTSGVTTGPHLHYEVMVRGRQVDPLRVRFGRADSAAGPVLAGHPVSGAVALPMAGAGAGTAAAMHESAGPSAGLPPR